MFGSSRLVRPDRAASSKSRRWSWLVVAVAVGASALATLALAGGASARSGASKPELTYSGGACSGGGPAQGLGGLFSYPTLLFPSKNQATPNNVTPGLAASWKIFGGNKDIEFTLRPGARFSDGSLVDANAVKASLEYLIYAPNHNGFWTLLLGPVRSITVVSKWVVRVTLRTPNPNLPFAFSFGGEGMVAPKMAADLTANPQDSAYATNSDGAGPYILDHADTVIGTRCVFVPNPNYADKSQQHWSKIVDLNITDPNAVLAALKTGQISAATGDPSTADAAAAAGMKVSVAPQFHFYGLTFLDRGGQLNPALADVRVRRALNYAIDRKTIAAALFGKYASATSQALTATDGSDPKLTNAYPYNPSKAQALLNAAGYSKGFTMSVVGAGSWLDGFKGNAITLSVCKYLAAVNVTCNTNVTPDYQSYAAGINGDYDAGLCPCGSPITAYNYTWFLRPGLQAQHGWVDRVSEKLWEKLLRANVKTASQIDRELVARWTDQAYLLPVLSYESLLYYNPKVVSGAAGTNNWGSFWTWPGTTGTWSPVK